MNDKKLIVIAGPTAVGKTHLAIQIARDLDCEIISADSRQIYKEMNVGTAKPSIEDLEQVRHHFINFKSIHEYYSAGRFEVDVMNLLRHYNKKNIIMAGGSGLYIKAVCEGIDEMPDPDPGLRMTLQKRYEEKGLEDLTEELRIKDMETWNSIDLHNPIRVIRALEVIHQTGRKFSGLKAGIKKKRNFSILKIGLDLPRDTLYNRINTRVDHMIELGLMDEVRSLWPWRMLNALDTVGYTEFFNHLRGDYDLQEAIRLCKRNTRRYAKRQITWFRKEKDMHWFSPENHRAICQLIEDFLPSR